MPVTETEIEAKVIDIVSEQMGVDRAEITRETSFANDLNADSLDTVELVMEFEDEFNTPIPDDEAERFRRSARRSHISSRSRRPDTPLVVEPVKPPSRRYALELHTS